MNRQQARYVKQYASGILDYSSQYGSENPRSFSYSISNAIGEPKVFPRYGDYTQAAVMRTYGPWWKSCELDDCDLHLAIKNTRPSCGSFQGDDYIDFIFEQAVYPWSIAIYETYNPGAVVRILAMCEHYPDRDTSADNRDHLNADVNNLDLHMKLIPMPHHGPSTNSWHVLWEQKHSCATTNREARMFAPILKELEYRTRVIRLEFGHAQLEYYTEIDAVELTGTLAFHSSSPVDPILTPPPITSSSSSPHNDDDEDHFTAASESKVDLLHRIADVPHGDKLDDEEVDCVTCDVIEDPPRDGDAAATATPSSGYFAYLPSEIIGKIFALLPLPDLINAAKVCRLFRSHSYDPRALAAVDAQPYWHRCDARLLDAVRVRFPDREAEKNSEGEVALQWINFSWLGGGGVVSSEQLVTFLTTTNLSSLRHLDIASSPCVCDVGLRTLVRVSPLLCYLSIASCDQPTPEGIRVLGDLTRLRFLNLYRTQVDDAGVICIIQNNKDLESVNMGSCLMISDFNRVFEEMGTHCPHMRAIDAWRAKTLTQPGLEALLAGCHVLEQLDLGWCIGLTSSTSCFEMIATKCPRLTKVFLTANRTLCDNDIMKLADNCHNLRQLDILGTRLVTRQAVEHLLCKCPHLQFLDLSFCYTFTPEVIDVLRAAYPHVDIKRSFQD